MNRAGSVERALARPGVHSSWSQREPSWVAQPHHHTCMLRQGTPRRAGSQARRNGAICMVGARGGEDSQRIGWEEEHLRSTPARHSGNHHAWRHEGLRRVQHTHPARPLHRRLRSQFHESGSGESAETRTRVSSGTALALWMSLALRVKRGRLLALLPAIVQDLRHL